MIITIVVAAISALALLLAGYLLGVKLGFRAREQLREQLAEQKDVKIDALLRQGDALKQVIEPLTEWDVKVDSLREAIKQIQESMQSSGQSAVDLNGLQSSSTHRRDLAQLMNEIAEKAKFTVVLLSDENGLPLAASRNIADLDRLAAISAFVVNFGDRIRRNDDFMPVSLLFNDSNHNEILCRILKAGNRRLVLTAMNKGIPLTLNALDPALPKVISILSSDK
jgi:hypothetical protein